MGPWKVTFACSSFTSSNLYRICIQHAKHNNKSIYIYVYIYSPPNSTLFGGKYIYLNLVIIENIPCSLRYWLRILLNLILLCCSFVLWTVLYINKNWLFRTRVSPKYFKFVKFPTNLRETLKEAIPRNSRLRENLATWRACQIQVGGSIYRCSVSAN